MKIDVNEEELEFMMSFCSRAIEFGTQLGEQCGTMFDPARGENIEKATILYNKFKNALNEKD